MIAQRRDDFLSPEFRWLVALLRQMVRPLDQRNVGTLVESFNRMANKSIATDQVIAESEATGHSYLETWQVLAVEEVSGPEHALIDLIEPLIRDLSNARTITEVVLDEFTKELQEQTDSDLAEDLNVWRELSRDIAVHIGKNAPID